MTQEQRALARHALGLNRATISFRNHFVTGSGSLDHEPWMAMVKAGDARRREGSELTGGDDLFILTRQGAEAALLPGEMLDREAFPPNRSI